MRLSSIILPVVAFILAAALSVLVAVKAANVIEKRSQGAVKTALLLAGDDWAKVDVDGLQVILTGTALSEAQRFHALSAARSVVDAERVIDRIEVADALKIPPPEFSIEILRNRKGISLIGLAPQGTDRAALAGEISQLAGGAEVTDMLDTAAYPAPEGYPALPDRREGRAVRRLRGRQRGIEGAHPRRGAGSRALRTSPSQFEAVSGRLEADLPESFTLHAVLPQPVKVDGTGADTGEGPPEFVATRSPEGLVQLKGRLADERLRKAVNSFAHAHFGIENVDSATRLDPDLPSGWPVRVLAGLEALSKLNNGAVVIQPDFAQVRGISGNPEARAEISRLLSDKLGAGANFEIDVKYRKRLDPKANLPTPEECAASINAVLKENKITFAPGSATIDPSAGKTLDRIAEILKKCEDVKMEIAGHTDSQGREEMNLNLSQARAEAVLTALMARRILTSGLAMAKPAPSPTTRRKKAARQIGGSNSP